MAKTSAVQAVETGGARAGSSRSSSGRANGNALPGRTEMPAREGRDSCAYRAFRETFVVPRDERDLVGRIERAGKKACALDWRLWERIVTPVRCLPGDRRPAQPKHPVA